MALSENAVISKGSLVLVTGVNGFVGSHVANQFLQHGYMVRGTVRDPSKSSWLSAHFDKVYGPGTFELVSVPDMTAEGAYDEVVKGVSAIAHVASVMTYDSDPNNVIPAVIAGAMNAFKAALAESSVKRFVFTSSSAAAVPINREEYPIGTVISEESWSDNDVKLAWAPPPYSPERSSSVYAASKVEAERAIWKHYETNQATRPDLVVNTVLPNMNFGRSLDPTNQGYPSTSGTIVALWNGQSLPMTDPQYFINVEDIGLLHVAATLLPDCKHERIFGFAEPVNWDKVLEILRKQHPGHMFPENFAGASYPFIIKPRARAEQLPRKMGRTGFTSLEDSLLQNTASL